MSIETVLLAIAILGIGLLYFKKSAPVQSENELKLKSDLERMTEKVGEVTSELEEAKKERDELSGKGKTMFAQQTKLEGKIDNLQKENDALTKKVARFELDEENNKKRVEDLAKRLETSEKSFQDEKKRIQDEERVLREQREAERDRIWNDHEQNVIAHLRELCKKPEYYFSNYDNESLPLEFSGRFKPDFLLDFLDQYVIFDAKASKAEGLSTYIRKTIKDTVDKIKDKPKIAKFVYLVVPTEAIQELKTHFYIQDGYTFYVVSPEALAPILASLKRITAYELAEQLDPKDREGIVNIIAKFDTFVSFRNALDILLAEKGAQVVGEISQLSPDLTQDIADRKEKYGVPSFKQSDVKRLMDGEARSGEIEKLVNPRAKVLQKSIESVKEKILK